MSDVCVNTNKVKLDLESAVLRSVVYYYTTQSI